MGPRPTAGLANSSLEAACATLAPSEAPAVHSDRGGHYRLPGWVAICEAHGPARSMSRRGRSPDNAHMEGFIAALDEWMRWFRKGRISQKLGWLTPDEHRAALGYPVL